MAKLLIIGAGVSGLSAGIYARLSGHSAVICEQHSRVGGNLTGWQRGKYKIDNCIHWLTGTNPKTDTYKMWCELGALGGVEIIQGESLYTCERDGKRLTLGKSIDRLERDMLTLSPQDKKEILSFTAAVRAVQGIEGIAGTHANEGISLSRLAIASPKLLKYFRLSTGELARRFFHPLLRDFTVSVFGEQFSSLAPVFVAATFTSQNGGIPRGSSEAMAQRMQSRFLALGGEVRLNKRAVKVNGCDGRASCVDFSDGSTECADYIILAIEPKTAYERLLEAKMPPALERIYTSPDTVRFSSFHTAFSADSEKIDFKGDLIFPVSRSATEILGSRYLILREFSHEPSFYPQGKNIIQSMTFCDFGEAERFISLRERGEGYNEAKKQIADTVKSEILAHIPELSRSLELLDVWTPATYKRYTGAELGEYMSSILPPCRLPIMISSHTGAFENVLLATQWQKSPGGLPIAAEAGKRAIDAVNKLERKNKSG